MLQSPGHFQHNLIKKMKNFDEYIDWRINEDFNTQYSFLSENNNNHSNITMDFIGKFETIETDFLFLKEKLYLEGNLPHSNKSKRTSNQDYYSETSKKMIEDAAKKDIEYFGYDFNNSNIISGENIYKKTY